MNVYYDYVCFFDDITSTHNDNYSFSFPERFFLDGEQVWDETACLKHSPLCEPWLCVMSAVSVKWAQYVAAKCDRRVRGKHLALAPAEKQRYICLSQGWVTLMVLTAEKKKPHVALALLPRLFFTYVTGGGEKSKALGLLSENMDEGVGEKEAGRTSCFFLLTLSCLILVVSVSL